MRCSTPSEGDCSLSLLRAALTIRSVTEKEEVEVSSIGNSFCLPIKRTQKEYSIARIKLFLHGQNYLMIMSHLTYVYDSITHTTKCRIDGDSGNIGNLFEAEILIETHIYHLTLRGRQHVY